MSAQAALADSLPAVQTDRQYGAFLPGRWVPAPRYLLRRDRILTLVAGLKPGKLVEVGCGAGSLLCDMAVRGHECIGIETSDEARQIASTMTAAHPTVSIRAGTASLQAEQFDSLMSFDVLEHIEDDHDALKEWVGWLKPGGTAVLSVPAHRRLWSKRDQWAGHFRRYDRKDFVALVERAGLQIERLECCGYPLANFTHWLANLTVKSQDFAGDASDVAGATAASGTDRSLHVRFFALQRSVVGRIAMALACAIQRLFLRTDLGEGYVIVARKP